MYESKELGGFGELLGMLVRLGHREREKLKDGQDQPTPGLAGQVRKLGFYTNCRKKLQDLIREDTIHLCF